MILVLQWRYLNYSRTIEIRDERIIKSKFEKCIESDYSVVIVIMGCYYGGTFFHEYFPKRLSNRYTFSAPSFYYVFNSYSINLKCNIINDNPSP